jgi:hypothetical protein
MYLFRSKLSAETAACAGRNALLRRLRVDLAFDLQGVRWLCFVCGDGHCLLEWAKACDVVAHFDVGGFARKDWLFRIAWNGATAATFGIADDERLVASVRELEVANSLCVALLALKDVAVVDFGNFKLHKWAAGFAVLSKGSGGEKCQECENTK